MKIKMVLFDLDGTLLPMQQEHFVADYVGRLSAAAAEWGYDPKLFGKALLSGTGAMMKNDGTVTNEQLFWKTFETVYGKSAQEDEEKFEAFYKTEFQKVQAVCGFEKAAGETIKLVKGKGLRVALATNPLFPKIATESRMRWAGLDPDDFEEYTTFENYHYGKPNLKYYEELLHNLGVQPWECLMVGNDVGEDMVARKLGMQVFLLTDCLINKNNADISQYQNGSFPELKEFLKSL